MYSGGGALSPACTVCAYRPAAKHYGCWSCEGCRAFFKRNVGKNCRLRCFFGGVCDVSHASSVLSKSRCKSCRYDRCLQQGMDTKAVNREAHRRKLRADVWPVLRSKELGANLENQKPANELAAVNSVKAIRAQNAAQFGMRVDPDFGSLISATSMSSIEVGNERAIPKFLREYKSMLENRDSVLMDTIMAVSRAAFYAYHDALQENTAFMKQAICAGEVPKQPEQSAEITIAYLAYSMVDQRKRNATFLSLLPGYSTLDDKRVFDERCIYNTSPIPASLFYDSNEMYYLIGPEKVHYCNYWREQLVNKDYTRLCNKMMKEMHKLGLTATERYIIIAAIVFKTKDTGIAPDFKSRQLRSLHRMYLAALEFSIRARSTKAEELIRDTRKFMEQMELFEQLIQRYIPSAAVTPNIDEAVFSAFMRDDEGLISD